MLTWPPGCTSDYVHANWLPIRGEKKFICTQGPTEKTVDDFWSKSTNVLTILIPYSFRTRLARKDESSRDALWNYGTRQKEVRTILVRQSCKFSLFHFLRFTKSFLG